MIIFARNVLSRPIRASYRFTLRFTRLEKMYRVRADDVIYITGTDWKSFRKRYVIFRFPNKLSATKNKIEPPDEIACTLKLAFSRFFFKIKKQFIIR